MYLYGASGHCKVIIDIITSSGNGAVEAIYDDNPALTTILGIPVYRTGQPVDPASRFIISIGSNATRKKIAGQLDVLYATVVHEKAVVSNYASIGQGTVVMAGAIVNPDALIGSHCIINTGAVIEHDCRIGDFAHISPNAALAGNVTVGEGSHIGIGACVIQGITIGKWVTVGAGSVVVKDVPDFSVVVGNPARIIRYNDSPSL